VVLAILEAGADTAAPRSPEAIVDPALAEGCRARGRPVQGIVSVEGVREIEVLNLDGVAGGGYPVRKCPCSLTAVKDESSSILHSTYAKLVF